MIYVALGSNLGDRKAQLEEAVRRIACLEDVRIMARSEWWENPAVSNDFQPPFLNGVMALSSSRNARDLMAAFQHIERELGRETNNTILCIKKFQRRHPQTLVMNQLVINCHWFKLQD